MMARSLKPKTWGVAKDPPVDQQATFLPKAEGGRPSLEYRVPDLGLEDLILAPETAQALRQIVREHQVAADLLKEGVYPTVRVMFDGPPGTGKTSAAGALARALEIPFLVARQHELINQHMGESDKAVARLFDYARMTRAVFLLDEFDGVGAAREDAEGAAVHSYNMVVTTLLSMLERHTGPGIVIAATNRLEVIDRAARRRFDTEIHFPLPDDATRRLLIERTLGDSDDTTLNALDVHVRTQGSHAEVVRASLLEKRRRVLAEIEMKLQRAEARSEKRRLAKIPDTAITPEGSTPLESSDLLDQPS